MLVEALLSSPEQPQNEQSSAAEPNDSHALPVNPLDTSNPGGADDETPANSVYTLHLTRDNLLLIGSVGFLLLAFMLAIIFGSPASAPNTAIPSEEPTASAASLAQQTPTTIGADTSRATQTASQPVFTSIPDLPSPTAVPPPATSLPEPSVPVPTPANNPAYPAPGNPVAQAPTATSAAPIFAPTLTTLTPAPGVPFPTSAQPGNPVPPTPAIPTQALPTQAPPPTQPLPPTAAVTPTAAPPTATPVPTAQPVTILRGTNYWRAAQSPYIITQDIAIAPGATLIIEPGVEVRIAPGISISTEGRLYALGKQGQMIRIIGQSTQRWEGIFGRAGGEIIFEQVEVRGGGAGGTVLLAEQGTLVLRGVRFSDNGGHIRSIASRLEVRDSEISGNDMPYGAALEASFNGGSVSILNNRIGGNRMASGAAQLLLQNESNFEGLSVDVQGNLLIGQDGPNLTLATGTTELRGNVICNTLINGANGLSIRSETNQTPGFPLTIRDNLIDDHTPPVIPIYLKLGIGRGATSEVQIDMRNNWWGSDAGPYEPDRHADGRGDSVGENISFDPWLTQPPTCAPRQ